MPPRNPDVHIGCAQYTLLDAPILNLDVTFLLDMTFLLTPDVIPARDRLTNPGRDLLTGATVIGRGGGAQRLHPLCMYLSI